MNPLRKTIVAGLATSLLLSPFLIYKERKSYQCSDCLSKKHVYQWYAGVWPEFAIPVSFQRTIEEKSRTLRDFAPVNHTHDWIFAQGSPYIWFGTSWAGCAIGRRGSMNDFAQRYEGSDNFREFIRRKQREGLDSKTVYQMLILPRTLKDNQMNDSKLLGYTKRSNELSEEYQHWNDLNAQ
ncbi:MAG TPA: hypothetical protein VN887_12205 [Candidatus Angelobacter sp.]|nr:hypothetical protein [Candidatus Angelobacter sp.]